MFTIVLLAIQAGLLVAAVVLMIQARQLNKLAAAKREEARYWGEMSRYWGERAALSRQEAKALKRRLADSNNECDERDAESPA